MMPGMNHDMHHDMMNGGHDHHDHHEMMGHTTMDASSVLGPTDSSVHAGMDHDGMDHGGMDHGGMDHGDGGMDHMMMSVSIRL